VEVRVNKLLGVCLGIVIAATAAVAKAESLRCNGESAVEGDSRISVLYKCGQPLLADTHCAAVYYGNWQRPVPDAYAGAFVPCQPVEEWLYDRGPGNLMATVRFRSGHVQSIKYSRAPQ
jgi:hypothetical protein